MVGVVHCYCKRLPYIFLILGKQKKRNEDLKKQIANLKGELNADKDQPQQQGEFRIDLSIGLNCMNIFQIREIIFFQGLLKDFLYFIVFKVCIGKIETTCRRKEQMKGKLGIQEQWTGQNSAKYA